MSENADEEKALKGIKSIKKSYKYYIIHYHGGETAKLWILNNHVFRFYMSPTGKFLDYPKPRHTTDVAKINIKSIEDYGTETFENSYIEKNESTSILHTENIEIVFDNEKGTLSIRNKNDDDEVLTEEEPLRYSDEQTTQTLAQHEDEYFFAGGMQNGRFSHKGESIYIENTNMWINGGVTSPSPFYWSSYGYGVLRNTWQDGYYDFGVQNSDIIEIYHKESHMDAFYFINKQPRHILNDYYELTGQPIFMPEYAFYEAHLNTFNRDYWVEVAKDVKNAILFEDGKFYKKYQPTDMDGKTGILESLNGERDNYQFSARAMIDRYKNYDIPLGWFIPNDGYGSGYGQTDSLEGDIKNLQQFVDYAHDQGVEVALWTECNLEPKDPEHPKKGERDLSKEVGVGAVALKCDVAWIGKGYSFGLTAVNHATDIFVKRAKTRVRPLIIMVDGWAGTQRYAGIWSGDQTGGKWEYIRFHIPTYIGAGLSGLPIVGSDMDGIYGGGDREVNIRDFQWKAFTPLQLNMDGWGNVQKTPFSFDLEATSINRAYLKLKSMLLQYNYTIAHESLYGLPMIRAMFLEFPNDDPAYTKDSQYQYMWGPSLLVAPVYQKLESGENQIRNLVYLPDEEQIWIDFFTGDKYQGGKVYNNCKAPLWKIPVFVREGAIIPFVNDNNNPNEVKRDMRTFIIYPNRETEFEVYEDDGKSAEYLDGRFAKTSIHSQGPKSNENGDLYIRIHKTKGEYNNFIKERTTVLKIKASKEVEHVKAAINGDTIHLTKVKDKEEFEEKHNVYYFDQKYLINPYLKTLGNEELHQKFLLIKIHKTDVTETEIHVKVAGYTNYEKTFGSNNKINHNLMPPDYLTVFDDDITSNSIQLQWQNNEKASYYEIERDGVIFSNILRRMFNFEDFKYDSEHSFKIRSVNNGGVSKWSYTIVVKTKEDPQKNVVKDVTVTCNTPCQPMQEVCKLTECDNSIWHTDWQKPGEADTRKGKIISLSFNLNDVYDIEKIEYIPREDLGNGTFLRVQYRYSTDGENWSELSPVIDWKDTKTRIIELDERAEMKYFELKVLETVGGFGSGRNVLFYKKV